MLIHPFRWRDLGLIRRLGPLGVPLHSQFDQDGGSQPLRSAITGSLPLRRARTYILEGDVQDGGGQGFLQVQPQVSRLESHLLYLSPSLEASPEAARLWLRLLNHVCTVLGEEGCVRVYASLPEGEGEAPEVFRLAGFNAYGRDEVYEREVPETAPEEPAGCRLRRQRRSDTEAVLRLFLETAPRPVQQAQLLPVQGLGVKLPHLLRGGLVMVRQEEVQAHVRLRRLGRTLSARVLMDPDAAPAAGLLQLLMRRARRRRLDRLQIQVPEYQSGLRPELAAGGFRPTGSWLRLVKQTAVPVWEPVRRLGRAMEELKPTVSQFEEMKQ